MNRIAYIISAYKDAPHLLRLVNKLNNNADFYVHVDLRTNIEPFNNLLKDKVTFVPRHWVSWGGWEQVEYQKELLKAVIDSQKEYSHVVCLSGQDYPLWSNEQIYSLFKKNPAKEFIYGYNLTQTSNKKQKKKIIIYHFFRDLKWKNLWWKNKLIVMSRHIMKILPIRKKAKVAIGNKECDIYFGSDYWALTLPCARHVYNSLCTENKLQEYFQYSFIPSEMCIQTIVFNSPFAKNAMLYEGEYPGLAQLTPLHYINYGECIKILTKEDFPILQKSGKIFCRKIVSGISDELIKAIEKNQ